MQPVANQVTPNGISSQDVPKLGGWLYLPLDYVPVNELAKLKSTLVHQPPPPLFTPDDDEDVPDQEPVLLYDERLHGHIGIPRAFGLTRYPSLAYDDRTTLGQPFLEPIPKRPDPNHPRVRDPFAQGKFMDDLIQAANTYKTFNAEAPTGSGKTVCALNMAAELGHKTIILVHLSRLMDQWMDEIHDKLGVPHSRIGKVQGPICEFHDKDFVVGMLPSLNLSRYPREFYRAFGTLIADECHKLGTRFFAPACGMFMARYKIGLSATMKRRDQGEKVFIWHLGPVRVRSQADALPMKVYVMRYANRRHKKYGRTPMAVAQCFSRDEQRNQFIGTIIKKFHEGNRQALIVGSSVLHLQHLMQVAESMGVPRSVMGQFTGDIQEVVAENGKRKVHKYRQSKQALTLVKENARLIFATYGMITEGIDIPRLDAGIDVTPRSTATQLIGRLRRPVPGKKEPLWVTLYDTDFGVAKNWFFSRCKDYQSSGAEVVNYGKSKNGT